MTFMSAADQERVDEAIAAAERKTSGEIVAVVAGESSTYLYAPVLWAALTALLVPWPLIWFTWLSVYWIYLIQLAVFAAGVALLLPRATRYRLVPTSVKHSRAHRRAVEQFLAQNLHTTEGRTGVLIFVSVAERYAEVLADSGINARVTKTEWQAIVDELVRQIGAGRPGDGFVAAVGQVGKHLAKHFPPGTADRNELSNHLIILD